MNDNYMNNETMKTSDPNIILEFEYKVSPAILWNTITDPLLMKEWFFNEMQDFKAITDFETQFVVSTGERSFPHQWKITEVIPCKRITYDWSYEGFQGRQEVCFEIKGTKAGSTLLLSVEILEDFEEEIPEFQYEACKGGWNYFLDQRLRKYLKKNEPAAGFNIMKYLFYLQFPLMIAAMFFIFRGSIIRQGNFLEEVGLGVLCMGLAFAFGSMGDIRDISKKEKALFTNPKKYKSQRRKYYIVGIVSLVTSLFFISLNWLLIPELGKQYFNLGLNLFPNVIAMFFIVKQMDDKREYYLSTMGITNL